jgi:DNA (cytosine-5)-methyltransferase 1
MPRYPFEFHQADALEYLAQHWREFDAFHASPPCQKHTTAAFIWRTRPGYDYDRRYPDLIDQTRAALQATGKPWVIENVPAAPLENTFTLCGLMFGLKTFRHRKFEASHLILAPSHVKHPKGATTNSFGAYSSFKDGATHITVAGHNFNRRDGVMAFGDTCGWMTREELAEAIPPAYTEYIGWFLMAHLKGRSEAHDNPIP